ncbi:MAG: phosphoribosylglycinamide formyltransferase [Bacteroidetes bacterium]|nr:phosphoribosylglycinamide formyltransferase [Bacteroidota bacterium]
MIKLNLGFLASHNGSNMQAIINNVKAGKLNANLCAVISNNRSAIAIEKARNENIPAFIVNSSTHPNNSDKEIVRILQQYNVNTVILAGYMKAISKYLIDSFNGRVLNIHPALLPKYGGKGMYGMNVHQAVIKNKESISGATIHLVNEEYDKGPILAQKEISVLPEDTTETLAEKVLKIEHNLYTDVLIKISNGEIVI